MLKLGVPSKGRLMQKTFDWFQTHGITLKKTGNEREYSGTVSGIDGIELILMSAGEIPKALEAQDIQLGVTGSDLIQEKLAAWEQTVKVISPLGFGHADLIIAVPQCWVDVETLHDLDEVAAEFRTRHNFRLRIATKYHRMVREFLQDYGVSDYQIIDSQGATEGTIKHQQAEAIADITSTGETLTANNLKILKDGLIHASQATLFRGRRSQWTSEQRDTLRRLAIVLER